MLKDVKGNVKFKCYVGDMVCIFSSLAKFVNNVQN